MTTGWQARLDELARRHAVAELYTYEGLDQEAAALVERSLGPRPRSMLLDMAAAFGLGPGQLVVDATVPLAAAVSGRATRMLGVWQGSAAQQAAEMVPAGVRVVSALHASPYT